MIQKRKRPSTMVKRPRADKNLTFSYLQFETLDKYVTEQGAIVARAKTGLSQKQQRRLAKAIKHARHLALLPFTQTL